MMAISAKEMGFRTGVIDPTEDCPAAQVSDWHIVADYDDQMALEEMARRSQVITMSLKMWMLIQSIIFNILPITSRN